ncbi:MAG: hypothetical protein HY696_04150 [Deltaproteobacteria bacterium]|nr:hypothetical protein [Deltaproteobacteria bacterium]
MTTIQPTFYNRPADKQRIADKLKGSSPVAAAPVTEDKKCAHTSAMTQVDGQRVEVLETWNPGICGRSHFNIFTPSGERLEFDAQADNFLSGGAVTFADIDGNGVSDMVITYRTTAGEVTGYEVAYNITSYARPQPTRDGCGQ